MTVQENIKDFFQWVADQQKEINKLPEHFRRILLSSLLDTLSKCAFPKEKPNWKRFVHLIDYYSEWEHKDYVSLPQLRYLLLKVQSCQNLKREVEERINKWPYGKVLRPDEADPHLNELHRFRCGIWQEQIERARYPSLLWQMRNFAVHEFRSPGRGWAFSDDNTTPYYHGLLDEKGSFQSWELVIPCEVTSGIVQKCSENLKAEFEQKGLDPYNSFNFGSSWYP